MQNSRRQFLSRLITAGSGGVLLSVSPPSAAKTQNSEPIKKSAQAQGYQETEHVRAYYQRINF